MTPLAKGDNSHGKNMAKLLSEPNSLNTPAVTAQTVTVAGVCVCVCWDCTLNAVSGEMLNSTWPVPFPH